MCDFPRVRPHYAYVVVVEGQIKKVFKNELNAYAYLGSIGIKALSHEAYEAIRKYDLNTGEMVRGRQCLYGYDKKKPTGRCS